MQIRPVALADCWTIRTTRVQRIFAGWRVPEVLLNGNHDEIRRWRRQRALEKTLRNRPDLLRGASLSDEDAKILARIKSGRE